MQSALTASDRNSVFLNRYHRFHSDLWILIRAYSIPRQYRSESNNRILDKRFLTRNCETNSSIAKQLIWIGIKNCVLCFFWKFYFCFYLYHDLSNEWKIFRIIYDALLFSIQVAYIVDDDLAIALFCKRIMTIYECEYEFIRLKELLVSNDQVLSKSKLNEKI